MHGRVVDIEIDTLCWRPLSNIENIIVTKIHVREWKTKVNNRKSRSEKEKHTQGGRLKIKRLIVYGIRKRRANNVQLEKRENEICRLFRTRGIRQTLCRTVVGSRGAYKTIT